MTDHTDYEVGYKKPPANTRWKPGQSGNPKGRPKQIKDFDALLDRELSEPLRITENGVSRLVSKREVLLKTVVNKALKGDPSALRMLLPFMTKQQTIEGFEPDTEDKAALDELIAEYGRAGRSTDTPEEGDA